MRERTQFESNGLTVEATENVVWFEGEETTELVTQSELRKKANETRL